MKAKQPMPDNQKRLYQKPRVVDAGDVVHKTENNMQPIGWETMSDVIPWGVEPPRQRDESGSKEK